jgi:hypothetical protein
MTEQLARTRHLVATTAEWAEADPFVVASGEIAIEVKTDGSRWIKIGDGVTTFANLDYLFDFSVDPIFESLTVVGSIDAGEISADLEGSLYIRIKNADTESLAKGTPFYISGTAAEAGVVEVKKAIASDTAKGPAVGLVAESVSIGAEGRGVISGQITGYNTVFPGWQSNQALYVGQSGGLTSTAPAGYKQVIARVARINGSTGTLIVDRSSGGDTGTLPNSDLIAEGTTNLYFTQQRARNAISASGLIGYDPITGAISYTGDTPLTSAPPTDLSYNASTRLLSSSTGVDATLPLFGSTTAGLAPASGGGTANFLRADGTWAAPVSEGVAGVTGFSAGTTGLTPSVLETGEIVLGGTLNVSNGGTGATTSTGTGSVVLSNSPTLVSPALGTPVSGILSNCTGYTFANVASKPTTLAGYGITNAVSTISGGTTGLTPSTATSGAVTLGGTLNVANGGTGVTTKTGTGSVVLSNSPTLVTPVLGTPYSGNLANCSGYTFANIASKPTTLAGYGITDGVATFSGGTTGLTPAVATGGAVTLGGTLSVSNGGTGVTTSTGTGSTVRSNSPSLTSPVLTTPQLGTPTSGTLTNCTGYTFANIASKPTTLAGYGITDGVATFSGGTTGLTPAVATAGAITLGGTLSVANGGTGVTTSTGSGSVVRSDTPTLVAPLLGTPTSGNLANCIGYTFANIASKPTTLAGYGITDSASLAGNNAFTGSNTFQNATGQIFRSGIGQDGIALRGRSGGTSSFLVDISPETLTASRTLTIPNVNGTFVTTGDTGTVSEQMLSATAVTDAKVPSHAAIAGTKILADFGTQEVKTTGYVKSGFLGVTGEVFFGNTDTGLSSGCVRIVTSAGDCFIQAGANPTSDTRADLIFGSMYGATQYGRFTKTGKLWINTLGGTDNSRAKIRFTGGLAEKGISLEADTIETGTQWLQFTSNGGTERGYIDWNGSSVRYNTSSDYRLKENVVSIENALGRVSALKPKQFNFIEFPNETIDGFLAHEVAEVVPSAVSGDKDGIDEDGNPVYQGLDHSKLVPLLTAALQELTERHEQTVAELTARIEALEGAAQ